MHRRTRTKQSQMIRSQRLIEVVIAKKDSSTAPIREVEMELCPQTQHSRGQDRPETKELLVRTLQEGLLLKWTRLGFWQAKERLRARPKQRTSETNQWIPTCFHQNQEVSMTATWPKVMQMREALPWKIILTKLTLACRRRIRKWACKYQGYS